MIEFKMPDIGEGVAEGEIVKWLVKEGDAVVEDQPLVEVMTDKATVVIPCPTHGKVRSIRVGEGQTVRVGAALVLFDGDGAAESAVAEAPPKAAAAVQAAPPPPPPPPQPAPQPVAAEVSRSSARPQVQENGKRPPSPALAPPALGSGRILAAPATRKMAREAGVDLTHVTPTGPHGRITQEDVKDYLERSPQKGTAVAVSPPQTWPGAVTAPTAPTKAPTAPPPMPRPTFPPGPRPETRVSMRGVRKRISENMRRSKDHAAHFTYVEECDMTELMALRDSADEMARQKGIRLTYLPFIMKALVSGLKEFPYLNSSYDEEHQEIILKGYYNMGIAASNDDGLVVPVVKDCDRKSILEIAADIQYLADAARAAKLKLEDLQGSTFTITSLGALGGILATPVINYPEVAILGVHKIRKRPVVKDDQIVIRNICYLSISIDHRVVDGHIGAQFMQHVVRLLEDPRLLLLGSI